jgi:hypothetical protein
MSDNKTTPSDSDALVGSMTDLARQIGEMEPDDPGRALRLKELYTLTELSKSPKSEPNKVMNKRMNALRREVGKEVTVGSPLRHLIFRLPLSEYDNFVKALDPSSRAAEILKNACFQRETVAGGVEGFMEFSCTGDEQKLLLDLANHYYPAAAPFISRLKTP